MILVWSFAPSLDCLFWGMIQGTKQHCECYNKKGKKPRLRKHIQSIHTTEGKKERLQRVFIKHEDSQITELKIIVMCATFTFNK